MVRKILAWTLILTLNVTQVVWAQSPGPEAAYKQALERLDRYMELLEELRSHIDRSQFDTEALLDTLDYDEGKILAFVRDEIYFEQYPGLLRGAQGTLSSRAGNSLDQALLLATLLKDAGLDARIIRGELTQEEANTLLLGMTTARTPPKEVGNTDAMREAVDRFCQDLALDCGEVESLLDNPEGRSSPEREALLTHYEDTASHLFKILEQEGIELGKDADPDALVQEARDYFWVELQQGSADGWTAAHPAFGGTEPEGFAPERTTTYADEIPADLQHRVGFEVVMRRKLGTNEVEHELVPFWERPAANLDSLPLTFTIASKNLLESAKNPDVTFDADQIHSDLFLPSFSHGPANTAFDFAGNAVPMDAAASMFAGVFKTASDKLNQAAGALSGLGVSEPESEEPGRAAEVAAILSRFTSISPTGEERQYQRTIYDSRFPSLSPGSQSGPATRNQEIYRSMTRLLTFQVQTGSPSAAQILDSQFEALLQRRPSLEMMLGYQYKGEEILNTLGGNDVGDQISWTSLTMLGRIFDELPNANQRAYRDRPNIIAHHRTMPIGNTMREAVDIVQNGRRAYTSESDALVADPDALLRAGVWETVTEGVLLPPSSGPSINTADVFAASREAESNTRVVTAAQKGRIESLDLPTVSAEALERDLAMGYAVVFTADAEGDESSPFAWWRVDPSTGATLGMSGTGEGKDLTEYTILQKLVAGVITGILVYIFCDMARRNVFRDTTLVNSDCIILGVGTGVGAASGANPIAGVPQGLAWAVALVVLQKYIAPFTDV